MRLHKFTIGVAVIVVATGVILAAQAGADTPTTLYVDSTSNCSDTGSGTVAVPFCTITAALAAVQPGGTVLVYGGHDEAVVVNKSGTAAAPITIRGASGYITGADAGVTLDGVHDVVWSVSVDSAPAGLVVENSTRVTLATESVSTSVTATTPAISLLNTTDSTLTNVLGIGPGGGILLDAATSGVSLVGGRYDPGVASPSVAMIDVFGSHNKILDSTAGSHTAAGAYVRIEPGAVGNIVADNQIQNEFSDGVDDNGTGTDIVNNTISMFCDVGINIGPAATNASVENNIVLGTRVCTDGAAEHVGIGVFGAATATATVDYNTVTTTAPNLPYAWTTDQDTLAAFRQTSGQGAHDSTGSTQTVPTYASANTDSANSGAPGYQPTDINGHARVDNLVAANTGAGPTPYADRGAVETQPKPPAPVVDYSLTLLTGDPSPSWQLSATVTVVGTWAPVATITLAFDDGSPAVTQPATPDASGVAKATFAHVYHSAGLKHVVASAVDSLGVTGTYTVNIGPIDPEVVFLPDYSLSTTVAAGTPLTVQANSAAGWSGTPTFTINFGDGTAPVVADASNQATHTYQKAGTYGVTTIERGGGITYTSGASTAFVTYDPGRYTPVAPVRILDTRNAVGVSTKTPLAAGHTLKLTVAGVHGVPANATAVALNLTATQGASSGFLTAYADGQPRPNAYDLNWSKGATVPNFVIVPVVNSKIDLYNGGTGSVHVLADLAGYYSISGDDYTTETSRVIDTRNGTGTGHALPVQPGQTVKLKLSTAFPDATGLAAATFNVAVMQASKAGSLTVYPDGASRPTASTLNWVAGKTATNMAIVANKDGTVDFYNNSSGTIQLVVDAYGYFGPVNSLAFVPQDPNRVLDTRHGIGVPTTTALGPHQSITFNVAHTSAIDLFNVTVTGGTSSGYLSLVPAMSLPGLSTLNWAPGQTVTNGALVPVGDPAQVTVYNVSSGTVHVIVDELGTYTPDVVN